MAEELSAHEALEERLGLTTGLPEWPSALNDVDAIGSWMNAWVDEQLLEREIRTAHLAFQADRAGGFRELARLDAMMEGAAMPPLIAERLRQLGRRELGRLRPLADVRDLTKYRMAVDEGRAIGWWPIVYGLEMRAYSIPLTQGLLGYGTWALDGAIDAARDRQRLDPKDLERLEAAAAERLKEGVSAMLHTGFTLRIT